MGVQIIKCVPNSWNMNLATKFSRFSELLHTIIIAAFRARGMPTCAERLFPKIWEDVEL